jgi:hypothetical protein
LALPSLMATWPEVREKDSTSDAKAVIFKKETSP